MARQLSLFYFTMYMFKEFNSLQNSLQSYPTFSLNYVLSHLHGPLCMAGGESHCQSTVFVEELYPNKTLR